jgi:hypothetical protein
MTRNASDVWTDLGYRPPAKKPSKTPENPPAKVKRPLYQPTIYPEILNAPHANDFEIWYEQQKKAEKA